MNQYVKEPYFVKPSAIFFHVRIVGLTENFAQCSRSGSTVDNACFWLPVDPLKWEYHPHRAWTDWTGVTAPSSFLPLLDRRST
jgi:hypothetical protein